MKVSIGIPFYNAELFLADAIKSVIQQSFQDWELILVNDGSTDQSLSIAQEFAKKDHRIRVISDGKNKKLPTRLNQIIQESQYEYIARMDADDLMHPDRLKIQLDFLEKNKEFDLVSTGVVSINDKNQVRGIRRLREIYTDFSEVKRHYPIVHASILAKRDWYLRNKYDQSLPRTEDFELWCRAISKNDLKLAVLPEALYYYREEGLVTAEKLKRSYKDGLNVYKKYCKKPKLKILISSRIKFYAVDLLDYVGLLQKIIRLRNKEPISLDTIKYHEAIISNIFNN
ncbi:glycosyltransferase family 2 protein [Acinetobacter sp. YH12126]|uniref:glycosyltransferase family 2 protein n=1 Tax=Acinetobacter sp. YH12126 TaxID=2601111 RepID=UPI0015D377A8|nr:glycosyltransferase family 2 protein [Acinetobacter sp. YH12126]